MPDQCWVIRPAVKSDLLGLLQLFARSDEGHKPAVGAFSEKELSTWDTMLGTENLSVYVAELNGQVVGTAMLQVMPNLGYDCRPSGFIEAMVVSAKHRRQSIGCDMVRRLLADAESAGCHKIQLLTHKGHASDGAHDFYRSVGFIAEAEGFRLYLQPDS